MANVRIRLTEPQQSIVEIFVEDPAHDDEREDWWPKLDGGYLVFDDDNRSDVASLFTDISNAEENHPSWKSAAAISAKVTKAKPRKRTMTKKKNPPMNHPGLGAFIGSILGATPGVLAKSPAIMLAGSMVGGAAGGAIGATPDRRKRGALGGAVGGVLGPIGSGIGGYVGGLAPDGGSIKAENKKLARKKQSNPAGGVAVAIAAGLGVTALAGGYYAYKYVAKKKALGPGSDAIKSLLGNATLEEAPSVVGSVQQPILLQSTVDPIGGDQYDRVPRIQVKIIRPAGKTTIEEPDGIALGVGGEGGDEQIALLDQDGDYAIYYMPKKSISYLITGLTPSAAETAFELLNIEIVNNKADLGNVATRAEVVAKVIKTMLPKDAGDPNLELASKLTDGVETLAVIANQSYYNKVALGLVPTVA